MTGFLLRIIINAIVLCAVVTWLPGVFVDTLGGALLAAAIIGIANAVIRPLLSRVSMPLNLVTIGGFTFCANIIAPVMVINTLPGFQVSSLMGPAAGVMLMTVCSSTVTRIVQDR